MTAAPVAQAELCMGGRTQCDARASWLHVTYFELHPATPREDSRGLPVGDHMVTVRTLCRTHSTLAMLEDASDTQVTDARYEALL